MRRNVTLLSEIRRDLDTLGEETGDYALSSSPVDGPRHLGASDDSDSDVGARFGGAGGGAARAGGA